MRDIAVVATLLVAFATWVTLHVALSVRLATTRGARWRGLAAFVVPPVAPLLGFREGLRWNSVAWVAALVVYVAAYLAAS